jgi:hypothetical protein
MSEVKCVAHMTEKKNAYKLFIREHEEILHRFKEI